jgi:hypothetical protein
VAINDYITCSKLSVTSSDNHKVLRAAIIAHPKSHVRKEKKLKS